MDDQRIVVRTPRDDLQRIIRRDGWIEPRYSAWPLADGRPVSLAVALRSCGDRVDAAIVEAVILYPVVDSWEREGSHSQADVLALIQELGDVNVRMMRAAYGNNWQDLVKLLRSANTKFMEGASLTPKQPVAKEPMREIGDSDFVFAAAWTAMSLTADWPKDVAQDLVRAARDIVA